VEDYFTPAKIESEVQTGSRVYAGRDLYVCNNNESVFEECKHVSMYSFCSILCALLICFHSSDFIVSKLVGIFFLRAFDYLILQ